MQVLQLTVFERIATAESNGNSEMIRAVPWLEPIRFSMTLLCMQLEGQKDRREPVGQPEGDLQISGLPLCQL